MLRIRLECASSLALITGRDMHKAHTHIVVGYMFIA